MQIKSTAAGTTAHKSSKSPLLFRQALLLAIPMLCAVFSVSAQKILKDTSNISGLAYKGGSFWVRNTYPMSDTVSCYFLEIIDSETKAKWTKGFVIRNNGMIKFGNKTAVSEEYLPVTSGIVESPLFYGSMIQVKNKALQIVLSK